MSELKKGLELADTLGKLSKKQIKRYLILLITGITLTCLPFIVVTIIGVGGNSDWMILIGGIWKAVFGFAVATVFALIAIPVLYLIKGKQGVESYLRAMLGATLVGLSTSLLLMVTPIMSNPGNIPIFIICIIILGIIATLNFNIKLIGSFVGIIFVLTLLSFFLPNKFQEAKSAIADFDHSRSSIPVLPKAIPKKNYSRKQGDTTNPQSRSQIQKSENKYSKSTSPRILYSHTNPKYEIAVMISGYLSDSEEIASILRSKGKKAIAMNKIPSNLPLHAKYMISGKKSIQFGIDSTFGRSDIIEARVTIHITMTDTKTGSVIRKFQVFKKISGLSKESAGKRATKLAISEVNKKIS